MPENKRTDFKFDRLLVSSFCACSPIFVATTRIVIVNSRHVSCFYNQPSPSPPTKLEQHLYSFFHCVCYELDTISIRPSLSLSFAVSLKQEHLSLTFLVAAEVRGCGDASTTLMLGSCVRRLETTAPGDSGGERKRRLRATIGCGGDSSWRLMAGINDDGDRCKVSHVEIVSCYTAMWYHHTR